MENPEFTESSCLGCGFFFQSALALVPLIPRLVMCQCHWPST